MFKMLPMILRAPDGGDGGAGGGGGGGAGDGGAGAGQQQQQSVLNGGGNGAGGGTPPSFHDLIPAEYKGHPSLKDYKDVGSLIKSHVEQQKLLGGEKLPKPSENWKPEEWNSFWNALGRPEDAKGYKIPDMKWHPGMGIKDEHVSRFTTKFHQLGLTQNQMAGVMQEYNTFTTELLGGAEKEYETNTAAGLQQLQNEWGDDYTAMIDGAQAVSREFADEDTKKWLDDTGLGDDVRLIKLFANIGKKMAEDRARGGGGGGGFGNIGPAAAKGEIENLKIDKEFQEALNTAHHPGHKAAVDKWTRLHSLAYPKNNVDAA